MGLLHPSDWQADWIGMHARDGDPEFPWLRKTFALRAVPAEARAYVACMGYYELYVNGRKVDIPSYEVKTGDVVTVREKSTDILPIQHAIDTAIVEVRNQLPQQIGSLLKKETA